MRGQFYKGREERRAGKERKKEGVRLMHVLEASKAREAAQRARHGRQQYRQLPVVIQLILCLNMPQSVDESEE